jgi:hypothetical protein
MTCAALSLAVADRIDTPPNRLRGLPARPRPSWSRCTSSSTAVLHQYC